MFELQVLLSNVGGYGTDDAPITVGTLKALIIETLKELEYIKKKEQADKTNIFSEEEHY